MVIINITRRGRVEGDKHDDEHTRVHRQEVVFWFSQGNGPWYIKFGSKGSPLLDKDDDIIVPRDGTETGRSAQFNISTQADIDAYPYNVTRSRLAQEEPDLNPLAPGPELIVEGGGGLLHEKNPRPKNPKKPGAAPKTAAKKT